MGAAADPVVGAGADPVVGAGADPVAGASVRGGAVMGHIIADGYDKSLATFGREDR